MSRYLFLLFAFAASYPVAIPSTGIAATYSLTNLVTFVGHGPDNFNSLPGAPPTWLNGQVPVGGLVADAEGNLYGTTVSGGTDDTQGGTVYEIMAGTHSVVTLYSFSSSGPSATNGFSPKGGLVVDANGNLYGTTTQGHNNVGTIFEISAGNHALTTLYSFSGGADGGFPDAGLVADANGNLYGTASGFESNIGTVFEFSANTHSLTILHSFSGPDGSNPESGITFDSSGNLYGTTNYGGANNLGTVYEIAADTHQLTTLATFNGANGSHPELGNLTIDSQGNLYGATDRGGANGYGTIFEIAAGTHELTTLASFDGINGANPVSSLILDADGNLYGSAVNGGANNHGTIFELLAGTHTLISLVDFNSLNGNAPAGSVIADANGNLYGTTTSGGNFNGSLINSGTVFELVKSVPETNSFVLMTLLLIGLFGTRMLPMGHVKN